MQFNPFTIIVFWIIAVMQPLSMILAEEATTEEVAALHAVLKSDATVGPKNSAHR
jgi:hypothetical protein